MPLCAALALASLTKMPIRTRLPGGQGLAIPGKAKFAGETPALLLKSLSSVASMNGVQGRTRENEQGIPAGAAEQQLRWPLRHFDRVD